MRVLAHLHRSISFWAGLLVIVFITWAAVDSRTRSVNWARVMPSHQRISITNHALAIQMEHVTVTGGGFVPTGNWGRLKIVPRMADTDAWFPAASWRQTFIPAPAPKLAARGLGSSASTFIIPYWLIFALLIPPWIAISLWRAKRIAMLHTVLQDDPVRTPP